MNRKKTLLFTLTGLLTLTCLANENGVAGMKGNGSVGKIDGRAGMEVDGKVDGRAGMEVDGCPARKTVREFLKMSEKDTTTCILSGVVSRVRNNEYGRLFLDDPTGSVLIYGVYDVRGRRHFPALDIREGDSLTVQGRRFVYDGRVIEMKNAKYVAHIEGPNHANVPKVDNLDKNPTFKGKDVKEFSKWVSAHLVYPEAARKSYGDGTVKVRFIVGRDGSVLEPEVIGDAHPALKAEALRVISKSPKWKPGIVDNHPVRVTYTIDIVFIVEN